MLLYKMISKEGNRSHNEDYTTMKREGAHYCFVLADGLGGHGKGEVASQCVGDTAVELLSTEYEIQDYLNVAFMKSQKTLMNQQVELHAENEMKTTMVVLACDDNTIQWGHIGDSRLYYFQDNKLQTRTMDHSVPQMLVASGEIKEKNIRNHPDRNKLLRVMGQEWESPRYELGEPIQCRGKQAFLLCSDGFWELITEKKMQSCLKKAKSPEDWLESMEQIVLKNGRNKDMDNYSAIAVWCDN